MAPSYRRTVWDENPRPTNRNHVLTLKTGDPTKPSLEYPWYANMQSVGRDPEKCIDVLFDFGATLNDVKAIALPDVQQAGMMFTIRDSTSEYAQTHAMEAMNLVNPPVKVDYSSLTITKNGTDIDTLMTTTGLYETTLGPLNKSSVQTTDDLTYAAVTTSAIDKIELQADTAFANEVFLETPTGTFSGLVQNIPALDSGNYVTLYDASSDQPYQSADWNVINTTDRYQTITENLTIPAGQYAKAEDLQSVINQAIQQNNKLLASGSSRDLLGSDVAPHADDFDIVLVKPVDALKKWVLGARVSPKYNWTSNMPIAVQLTATTSELQNLLGTSSQATMEVSNWMYREPGNTTIREVFSSLPSNTSTAYYDTKINTLDIALSGTGTIDFGTGTPDFVSSGQSGENHHIATSLRRGQRIHRRLHQLPNHAPGNGVQ